MASRAEKAQDVYRNHRGQIVAASGGREGELEEIEKGYKGEWEKETGASEEARG